MQPTDQAYQERAQRYRDEEAILLALARRGEAAYPDLEPMLGLPQPELD